MHRRQPFIGNAQLRAITGDCYCDIMCQVIGCYSTDEENENVVLRIWDGSKVPLIIDRDDMTVVENGEIDEDLQLDLRGYFVDVYIHDEHRAEARSKRYGDFVYLKNVHVYQNNPEYEKKILVLHGGRRTPNGLERGFYPCTMDTGLFKRMRETLPAKRALLRAARLEADVERSQDTETQNTADRIASNILFVPSPAASTSRQHCGSQSSSFAEIDQSRTSARHTSHSNRVRRDRYQPGTSTSPASRSHVRCRKSTVDASCERSFRSENLNVSPTEARQTLANREGREQSPAPRENVAAGSPEPVEPVRRSPEVNVINVPQNSVVIINFDSNVEFRLESDEDSDA